MSTRMTTLAELVREGALVIGDGYRTKRSEHGRPGYRILRVADIAHGTISTTGPDFVSHTYRRQIGNKLSEAGDVILTTKGTVGRVAVIPPDSEPVVYSPQVCFFRVQDPDRLNPRFLRYWFTSNEFKRQASHRMNNTDMAAYINLADIHSLQLELPDQRHQHAIANVLGALDDKITANHQLVATTERLMTALASTATDTTPVRDLARHSNTSCKPEAFDAVVAHFSLPAFDQGCAPEMARSESIKSNKFLLNRPSVLMSKLNPRIPRIWDVPVLPSEMALASTEFVVLEPLDVDVSALWACLAQPEVSTTLAGKVSGTSGSHQRVKPGEVLALYVPDPRTLAPAVLEAIASLGLIAHARRAENAVLAGTRDVLLPELMSGKIRLTDAERVVEGVV